ncbi:hypothetical protein L1887_03711 [Cichorium endivia]|nr:hypothetical protein L1887_03711 [Cichorium endivia]
MVEIRCRCCDEPPKPNFITLPRLSTGDSPSPSSSNLSPTFLRRLKSQRCPENHSHRQIASPPHLSTEIPPSRLRGFKHLQNRSMPFKILIYQQYEHF